jgi:glycerol kinase
VPREALSAGLVPTVAWDLGRGMTYALDGGVQDAGSAIEWALRAGFAASLDDFDAVSEKPAIGRGLAFIPAFSGLGCPYWDRSAAPLLIGLRPDMGRADVCQALLEGIAYLTALVLEAMRAHAGLAGQLSIDGGLSKNGYFAQFLADCSGFEIVTDGFAERTAYGVAALAAYALGQDLALPPSSRQSYRPRPDAPDWSDRFKQAVERARGWAN